jgi:peptidoglycan/LPS O-acetylase OafA/YrhL
MTSPVVVKEVSASLVQTEPDDYSYRTGPDVVERAINRANEGESRIPAFDFVKGMLVLVMIVYHWLNYFIGLQWGGYRYLRFLTPSFILVTGFLVSRVYLTRYSYDDRRLYLRLVRRGFKLIVLFIILNIVADRTFGTRLRLDFSEPHRLLDVADAVFIKGTSRAAFDILVSIAYFLLIAPLVLFASKRLHVPLMVIAASTIFAVAAADFGGLANAHCQMVSIALVGLAAGVVHDNPVKRLLRSPLLLSVAYSLYLIAITVWNVLFPLQVVGVCLSVLVIYMVADVWGTDGRVQSIVVRLGQYSLMAYVGQIMVYQVLRYSLRGVSLSHFSVVIPLFICALATVGVVKCAVRWRTSSAMFDRAYRFVFA